MVNMSSRLLATLVLLAGAAAAVVPGSARAAQSYDACTGFIDSLSATVTQQGTWCLRKDLSTNITSGNAITIANNNVTIDCNDFKIGGLAAGNTSFATGVEAEGRQNATVRQCNVRGFFSGIALTGGAGHLVEHNRLDHNLVNGIIVYGDNNLVQYNRVYDTGGHPHPYPAVGIRADADVIGNTIAGVFPASSQNAYGIELHGEGNVARDNRIRGLLVSGAGAYGIHAARGLYRGITIDGNQLAVADVTYGVGIVGRAHAGAQNTVCKNNVIVGFPFAMQSCVDAGRNTAL